MGLEETRPGKLDVGEQTLVEIQLALLQGEQGGGGDEGKDEDGSNTNGDMRRCPGLQAELRVKSVDDTHGQLQQERSIEQTDEQDEQDEHKTIDQREKEKIRRDHDANIILLSQESR